jgi:ankyrin repeat protein
MVSNFKNTKAYELAKAVEKHDMREIERLVKNDYSLIDVANPVDGSNVLSLSINLEKFFSFERLLHLGANPNYINPLTKRSILIDAIKPFDSQSDWRRENKYAEQLLKYGADPNYVLENSFTNEYGHYIHATSPLIKASEFDLEIVKILIKNGADPNMKIGEKQVTAFSSAVKNGKFDIINFYIDSLGIDVHQPMSVVIRQPDNNIVTYYIQDYIVNKFTKAKLLGDSVEIERLKSSNNSIEEANQERWMLIKKLESMGVDFKNYDYKQ